MSAKAAQKVGQSVTSSTMWPTHKKQITAGLSPVMRVTAELLMQSFFWQSGSILPLPDECAVLAGKKQHTSRKKMVAHTEPPKVNLLVDIQAKLQAGKSAGYARWAKVFNLKQMAQTMNYLSEHNLLEYAVLEEKAAAATVHHNEVSAQIKAAEKSMAEIAVLRTHIVNYTKTCEVYVAYRKAGYSKKFREEHEEKILLHQAAKNAFDKMGVKKLPKVKELQTEYAKLLEEKKKIYAEYRRSREEMRQLLTAKANVARVRKRSQNAQPQNEILCSKGLVGAAPFYPKMKGASEETVKFHSP